MPNGQTLACGRYCVVLVRLRLWRPRRGRVPNAAARTGRRHRAAPRQLRQREHHRARVVVAGEPVDGRQHATNTPMRAERAPLDGEIRSRCRSSDRAPCRSCAGRGMVQVPHRTVRADRAAAARRSSPGGGGDGVAHSSVWPAPRRQAPARSPWRHERQTFQRNGSVAAPRRNAPIDEMRLSVVKSSLGEVAGDAAGHALEPEDVLHEERQVEADEDQPEVDCPEPLVEEPAGELREPVVDAGVQREHRSAEQHVVHVGDDEVRVGDLEVDRRRREHARR